MIHSGFKSIVVLAALVPVGNAAAVRTGRPMVQPPVIVSTAVDIHENGMVITGHHFGPSAPTVRLGDQILSVKSHTENQAVVGLPPEIEPATYRLTVTTEGPRRLTSDPFSATVTSVANR
ncbi:MAG: IPT/TIG domain-containing protein [Methylococcaceae bacterium]|nr:IPT/TIG domain-containing protein [Methylococcaceae bacterium]MCI0733960.1 IPT/TIG domain-containing protein [Methylococcaceae bacterium]